MKSKTVSFRTKLWLYFVLFAAVIFSLLWIMQTVGLQRFYDGMMKNNIRNAAKTIIAAGQKPIEILGPFPEIADAVEEVHRGFWNNEK